MTIQTWCLVDSDGNVQNVTPYDGTTPYTPPNGLTLQLDVTQQAGIGWIYSNGTFTNPNANTGD